MSKLQESIFQPHPLRQKQILQSIFRYVALYETARFARVSTSWQKSTEDGFKFHPQRLGLSDSNTGWQFCIDEEKYLTIIAVNDVSEHRRSHLLEITDKVTLNSGTCFSTLTNVPQNLKKVTYESDPWPEEVLDFLARVDCSKIEEMVLESCGDMIWYDDSNGIESIINAFPSLKKIESAPFCDQLDIIDFKRVNKNIETWKVPLAHQFLDRIPHFHGKVTTLELEDYWQYPYFAAAFNLEKIQGIEKLVWNITGVTDQYYPIDDIIIGRCEEVREKWMQTFGTSFKTIVIESHSGPFRGFPDGFTGQDLLGKIEKHFKLHPVEKWDFSKKNSQLVFNKI